MEGLHAIVLAAGESRRMGQPKMLLPFRGKTVIETVIDNITASGIDNIHVVLGANAEAITSVISKYDVKIIINNIYKEGMLSSVKKGFRQLPDDLGAVLVFPGDQPSIDAAIIKGFIKKVSETGKGIVIPVKDGRRGHPILISSKYRSEVLRLEDEEGLRGLSVKFRDDVGEIPVDDEAILRDIDTYDDYLEELNKTR
ncbi:MAG: nucleotidyltransferase family protein [Bacteroidales bacterium]